MLNFCAMRFGSWVRDFFVGNLPARRRLHALRMSVEQMEERVLLSASAVETDSAATNGLVYAGQGLSISSPDTVTAGQTFPVTVSFQNTGTRTWVAGTDKVMSAVTRTDLPSNVAPGQTVTVNLSYPAPSTLGPFNLEFGVAIEGGPAATSHATNATKLVTVVAGNPQTTGVNLTLNASGNSNVANGDLIAVIYTVQNTGGTLAQNVVLTITYDAKMTYERSATSDVTVSEATRTVTFNPIFVGPNSTDILTRETDFRAVASGQTVFRFTLSASNAPTLMFDLLATVF